MNEAYSLDQPNDLVDDENGISVAKAIHTNEAHELNEEKNLLNHDYDSQEYFEIILGEPELIVRNNIVFV